VVQLSQLPNDYGTNFGREEEKFLSVKRNTSGEVHGEVCLDSTDVVTGRHDGATAVSKRLNAENRNSQ
jgi:hypothetical protein